MKKKYLRKKDLCPFCRVEMKVTVSRKCIKCHHHKKGSALSKLESLKK